MKKQKALLQLPQHLDMVFSHGMPFLHAIGFEHALAFAVNSALVLPLPSSPPQLRSSHGLNYLSS
jgi:hypothetical protein